MTENLPEKVDVPVGGELQTVSASASAVAEIQSAIIVAQRFPRDEKVAWANIMEAMKRKSLAIKSTYSFPRGGKQITGPSVHVARVIAQYWGRMRWGVDIIFEDDDSIILRGWAWDVQHDNKVHSDHKFKKLIYRKATGWITPDERDLRELINKNAAILKRNALLELLPPDLVEDALGVAQQTVAHGIKDPKGESKKLILAFADFGVTPEMMSSYVGTDKWGAHDCVTLQAVLNALIDNVSNREVYFKAAMDKAADKAEPKTGNLSTDDMAAGDAGKHQGYDINPSGTSHQQAPSESEIDDHVADKDKDKGELKL